MSPKLRHACVFAALVALTPFAHSAGAQSRPSRASRPLSAYDEAAVARARQGAARRLETAECRKLLTDFKDRSGRPLETNLESFQLSPAEYLQMLPFFDGSAMSNCQRGAVELVTSPGLLPVYVCPGSPGAASSRFSSVQLRDPAFAEVMVIHEMLHTLGLGENPPTTFEITDQVRRRCR
jgi:hypothetical protein